MFRILCVLLLVGSFTAGWFTAEPCLAQAPRLRGKGQVRGFIDSLNFSPDGKQLVVGTAFGIEIWAVATLKKTDTLGDASIKSQAFSPDGKLLAVGATDKTVQLWDTSNWKLARTLSPKQGWVKALGWSGATTLLTGSGTKLHAWDAATGVMLGESAVPGVFPDQLVVAPDKSVFVAGTAVQIIHMAPSQNRFMPRGALLGHEGGVRVLALSPDGKVLASAGDDKTVRIWDAATRKNLAVLTGHKKRITALVFSPDGKTLFSSGDDGLINLWDVQAQKNLATIADHQGDVDALAVTADGQTLASGGFDFTLRLWDLAPKAP